MGFPAAQPATQMCGADAIAIDANSVVKLILTSEALRGYELEKAAVASTTERAPPIDANLAGVLSVMLQVPPSGQANYVAHLALRSPSDRIQFDCPLAVRSATEVPLSAPPVLTRTATVTPTPYGGPPTPTPGPKGLTAP
jgi:hypothetical protein